MRGKHNKLGEGERKVRLGQDSLPNIAISIAETSGNYIRCFTRTQTILLPRMLWEDLSNHCLETEHQGISHCLMVSLQYGTNGFVSV